MTRAPLPYAQLMAELHPTEKGITYEELLWTTEWMDFREIIIQRDNYTCGNCQKRSIRFSAREEFEKHITGMSKMFRLVTKDETSLKIRVRKYIARHLCDSSIKLEVHHKHYIWKALPWEYDPTSMITLCDTCHEDLHSCEKIKVYTDQTLREEKFLRPCLKCKSGGYLSQYKHYCNGVCFDCWGYGGY